MHVATPRILSAPARRRLVATVAGAATALALMTAAAAPARADDGRDLARALAAIAAVAIIAKSLENNNKRHAPAPAPAPAPVHVEPVQVWGHGHPGFANPGYGQGRPGRGWDHDRRRILPAECAIEFPGRHGQPQVVYAHRCLRRSGVEGRLPRDCEQQVRIRGREVSVYPQGCLIDVGFRPERGGRGPQGHGYDHSQGGRLIR